MLLFVEKLFSELLGERLQAPKLHLGRRRRFKPFHADFPSVRREHELLQLLQSARSFLIGVVVINVVIKRNQNCALEVVRHWSSLEDDTNDG
jgi:hypothetical protein